MNRIVLIAACLALSGCVTGCAGFQFTAADAARIAEAVKAGVRTSAATYCSLPPSGQAKVMKLIRKSFPDAEIACASIAGGPLVSGIPTWR